MASTAAPSAITSRRPLFEFTNRFVQPPGALYIDKDDRLVVEATSTASGTVFRAQLRILRTDSRILEYRQEITIVTARTPQTAVFDLPEGFLLGLDISLPVAAAGVSWNYTQVGLARGPAGTPDVFHGLAQGYIDVPYSLFWPGGVFRLPADGRGLWRLVQSAVPNTGDESTITVPANSQWNVRAMNVAFSTDATVANRRVLVRPTRSGTPIFATPAGLVQTASQGFTYEFAPWGESGDNRDGRILVNWPPGIRFNPGDVIVTSTVNLQAGDAFGPLNLYVEEWFLRTV